jgi:hypothetical protein
MGFLSYIRSRKLPPPGYGPDGLYVVIFWIIAGAALGFGVAQAAKPLPQSSVYMLMLVGGIMGSAVGFYAAWGVSRVARVLAIPGLIFGFLIGLLELAG